jgi:acetyl-CoA acetyltransferase
VRSGSIAIVGAAETDEIGRLPQHSQMALHAEAARNALRDVGLSLADVDGIAGSATASDVAHYLGVTPRWIDTTSVGGTSFLLHVRHAAGAIEAGLASTVLITHGESRRSQVGAPPRVLDPASFDGQYERPYGVGGPPSMFTVPALRFMKERNVSHEQLASVAVAQRRWANRVPRAKLRELITVDDVFNSPLIAYPFHLLECCLVTDAGGALILTSAERAADLPTRAVYILGTGESTGSPMVSQMPDFCSSEVFRRSSRDAFAEAGLSHEDIDHLMIYDAFAHVPLYGLEDIGFVAPGESGAFVAEGHTSPGGRLPMNTNGGGLSYTHTGMYGMFAIQEAVRQLRGDAAAQVEGVRTSFVQGVGGFFAAAGALVLGNQQP